MSASLRQAGLSLTWALALGAQWLSLPAIASTPGLLPSHPRVADAQLVVPGLRPLARPGLTSQAPVAADAVIESDFESDPRAPPFDALVQRAARTASLEAALLHAVIETESGYDPRAVSPRGAIGLMQVLPRTGARFGVRRLEDPAENLRAGAAYLQWLLTRFDGELPLALAAYNAGEGAVLRYGRRIPPFPETQNYVRKVMAGYSRLLETSALPGRGRRDGATRSEPSHKREVSGAPAVAGGVAMTSASFERGLPEARGGVAVQERRSAAPSTRTVADAGVGDTWRLLRGLGELMTRSPSAQTGSRDRPAVVMPSR
ncbi:lytic transglycosylase domain-containing protein [Pandoraea pulmonicola]|uniref:Soluble lytic murein transglycosylase n=1 Tax=Pandoraea pulmonicola TaxID=93221 RepID=A0AAJ4ZB78_PANPU|nr:lytic transglycosylase domain-containing protein [Pandoraea pulmonicola]APD13337.1 hypothetical protein RO07_25190 [Pandoraea pulmonicola]SUA90167.1 Soluble lytic murein transglycosylase precursor [Pandoraea pulmonicola]